MENFQNTESQENFHSAPSTNEPNFQSSPITKEQAKAKHQQIHPDSYHHGLAGHGVVIPGEDALAILERMKFWRKDFRPDSPAQEWQYIRICIESVQADICLHQGIALRDEIARRAGESWENDRLLDARKLYDKLHKRPEIVQLQLRQSKQGCEVLIEAWTCLAAEIRHQEGQITEKQWSRILDLLGKRIDQRFICTQEAILDENLSNVDAWINRQIANLHQEIAAYLDDRDDRAKIDTMTGVLPQETPEMKRLKVSENQAIRRMRWSWNELRRLQSHNGYGEYNRHLLQAPKPTYSPLPSEPTGEETNPIGPDGLAIHPKHIQTPQRELMEDFLGWYKKAQTNGQDPQHLPPAAP